MARHHASARRALIVRHALRTTAWIALAITIAVLAGVLFSLGPAGAWVRFGLLVLAALAALAAGVAAFARVAPGFDVWMEQAEARFPEIRSLLRNALDFEGEAPAHGSPALAAAVGAETTRRLEAVPLERMRPPVEPKRPLGVLATVTVALIVIAAVSPLRATRSWQTLWNPAMASPPVTLEVLPGDARVAPGAALAVHARVLGSTERPRILREGEADVPATAEGRTEDGAALWRFDLTQLTREQTYAVRVAHAESPRYRITLAGEPEALSFSYEIESPRYARLPIQRGASTRGDLVALAGSRAQVEVTFDRDLEMLDATLPGGEKTAWTAVTPRRWRGEVPVRTEGQYALHARAASGASESRHRVGVLADAPPIINVVTPEGDLDLPAGQAVALEIVGQDDLGLSELRLQWRKSADAVWENVPLTRFPEEPREARFSSRWDASALALLPGEAATFRFELFDDNAFGGRGRAVSPTFQLRFPSMAELYESIDARQGNVQEALERVSERAQELQKSLDKLARQQPSSSRSAPAHERAEEMRKAAERQQELAKEIDRAADDMRETLEQASERRAFNEELARKMQELNELMQQIQSKELREAMRRMQEALENLDMSAMERTLPELRERNKEMLNQLDRSIELMKRLREEERLDALAKRAEELKRQQDQMNESLERGPAKDEERAEQTKDDQQQNEGQRADDSKPSAEAEERLAEQQEQAAKRTEELASDISELEKSLDQPEEQDAMRDLSKQLGEKTAETQRQAAAESRQQQRQRASRSGQQASQQLEQAAKQLQQMTQQRQEERQAVDLAAVRRAAKDLVSLQRTAEENLATPPGDSDRADRQTDLSEGVARVADSLFTIAQRSPFITPKLSESLGRAMNDLSQSGRDLAAGSRQRGEQSGRQGAESLTEAILELRNTEAAMCQQPGQGGGQNSRTMTQRLGETGEQQSQLNRETRSVAQRLSEQMRLSAGDRQELQRLAERQQRLREELEQIQQDDAREQKLLGRLDQAQREMEEAEEVLREAGDLGQLEEKQQRILSRLLDAQRSVHRRDFDPEREARAGGSVTAPSPAELPAELLKQGDRLRIDMLKAEADRYPAQYRALIEAYLRSLNGNGR